MALTSFLPNEPPHEKQQQQQQQQKKQFTYAKTKAQTMMAAFVFATRIVQFLFQLNPKFQTCSSFLCCTGRFLSDLVGNHIVVFLTRRLLMCRLDLVTLQGNSERQK